MVRRGRYDLCKSLGTGGYGIKWCVPGRVYIGEFDNYTGGAMICGEGSIPLYMKSSEVVKVGTVYIKSVNNGKEEK